MAYKVLVITRRGVARLVLLRRGQTSSLKTGFTVLPLMAHDKSGELNARQAAGAVKWAKGRNFREVRLVKPGRYPFLELGSSTHWPTDDELLRKLNRVGRKLKRKIRIVQGLRTAYQQWHFRQLYLSGNGNLAARCCSKYWPDVPHSWADCGKQPQSNHCSGHAADCGVIDKSGSYVSIGNVSKARVLMRRHGLCLPVGQGEVWHVEVGSSWLS